LEAMTEIATYANHNNHFARFFRLGIPAELRLIDIFQKQIYAFEHAG